MSRIQVLPEVVANQIAAGEVIERPANVLKELLENSLDAQATQIDIVFHSGGCSFIQVCDNGMGMSEADAELCFKRHATSKLHKIQDLQQLQSFGFRGEALPSIASVAQVTLITRTEQDPLGTKLELDGGVLSEKTACPCSVGTTFIIQNLFYNVPVRRKFLKSETTENAHLIHCVRSYALAYPHVHFSLKQDQHLIFSSPQCPSLEDRIQELWPKRARKAWLPINFSSDSLSITGLMSPPGDGILNTQEISIFLNKRPINSTFFLSILKEAYRGYIPLKTYPSAFLFLTLPESEVDINVHPTKREVRFKHEMQLRHKLSEVLKQCLEAVHMQPLGIAHPSVEKVPISLKEIDDIQTWVSDNAVERSTISNESWKCNPIFKEDPILYQPEPGMVQNEPLAEAIPAPMAETPSNSVQTLDSVSHLNFFALWQNRYAFFSEPPALIVLDCAGAQKRLWYERIRSVLKKEQVGGLQTLLFPHTFTLEGLQAACLQDSIDYLNLKKFCILKMLSSQQFQLQAVPQWLPLKEIPMFINQLIENLTQWGQNQPLEQFFEPLLQQLVKTMVVSEMHSQAQVEQLCQELQKWPTYWTDPSGHRIWNRLTLDDLLGR